MDQEYLQRPLRWHNAATQVTLALLFVLLGTFVYWSIRPPGNGFLIPRLTVGVPTAWRDWLGLVAGQLPTFAHTVAFVLLSAPFASPRRNAALRMSFLWFGIEAALEAGQAAPVATHIAALCPAWFSHVPILDHTAAYFLHGTFDPLDMLAAALGAAAAFLILEYVIGKDASHGN